ncbi:MAG TPA: hypothetical protein VD971_10235 [Phycisphaerales bacterium]|nr:hypothetical protein [Phycisphaerales bacterium]
MKRVMLCAVVGFAAISPAALCQQAGGAGAGGGTGQVRSVRVVNTDPRRDTVARMLQPVTTEFADTRLEDVMNFIVTTSGADLEVMWADERTGVGLDKDASISAKSAGGSLLALLERVLERADAASPQGSTSTWQMSASGAMQIGPRERLNKFRRVEVYPVGDLLTVTPNYTDAPQFNLQQALQSSPGRRGGGGGGGQGPLEQGDGEDPDVLPKGERVDQLRTLLMELVEPEQWVENGGEAATMRYFQDTLIVNAPDYVHRGLNGYSWWPQRAQRVAMANGRRYVSLQMDTGASRIIGVENVPVTAVTGGGQIPPGGGPGRGPGG